MIIGQKGIVSSPLFKRPRGKNVGDAMGIADLVFRVREILFSRFLGYPTVGIRRDKKESGSTQQGICVGAGFEEFRQTS